MLRNRLPATVLLLALASLCAVLLAGPAAAPAEDLQSKLEAKESKLEKVHERKGVLTTTISHYRDEIQHLTAEVAQIRTREAAVRERLAAKQAELDRAVAELDGAKRRLAKVRTRLKRALVVLRDRLVAIYEAGSPDLLSVIVESDSVTDLATRAEYLDRVRGMDEAVVGRVRGLRDEVQGIVSRLRDAKDRIESARDAIASQQRQLASTRTSLQGRQGELVATRAKREAALARIGTNEAHLHDAVEQIQGKLLAQLESGGVPLPAGPTQGGANGLIWPVNGPIVSGFGTRWGRPHEGVDIAVPEMTPIRAAAAAGTVVATQSEAESGGYGNFTCIDHGGGLSTCYAHQSSFAVSAGQAVSQGEIIGYVGCTGHCFGPHLHFEVRIYGSPTDPMGYL